MALRRRESNSLGGAIWPGFVDAMTAMLLVLTFVLSIFMITQYFLRETITGQEDTIIEQEETIEEKERALDTLSSRLDSLSDILSLERTEKEKLAEDGTRLRASLATVTTEKEAANSRIGTLTTSLATSEEGRAALDEELTAERAALEQQQAETEALEALTQSLRDKAATDLSEAEAALSEAEKKTLIEAEAAKALRERLETSTAALTAMELDLDKRRAEAEETLTLLAAAEAAREEMTENLEARDADLTRQQALLKVARAQLVSVEKATEDEQQQVALLNEQTRELRLQLKSLEERLSSTEVARDTAETEAEDKTEEIASLGTRLNAALAERNDALEENRELLEAQVDELSDFRSEFFGQVRKVLGGRDEIKIVGDRFVFQSEVLFSAASAELAPEGQAELGKFANILNEISAEIPSSVNWILRIDGHTDKRPLRNSPRYRNNWELSQARALSVAEFLIREHNVPPERLAPTGFGEFQPLDEGDDPAALGRNRRIELKLTER